MPTISRFDPPTLLAKVDWYSFTLPLPAGLPGCGSDSLEAVNHALRSVMPTFPDWISLDGTWAIVQAKGFYQFRATHVQSHMACSWGEVNAHVFVELPGEACSWFREAGLFMALVTRTHQRASRVDCAIDIVTDTSPSQFVAMGFAERFSDSVGNIKSPQGATCYVGSRKSDRCARVYRYAPPHPRAHMLRLEAEYKGQSARELAGVLSAEGEMDACTVAHAAFGWKSPEVSARFLQLRQSAPALPTNKDMEKYVGFSPVFSPPLFDITTRGFWTLERGLARWLYQRWKTPGLRRGK